MEEDDHRALELSFTYGYGGCVFKHNIYGDQLEIPDCMPDSPNFLSPECFVSLRCPLSRHPLKTQLPRCIVERWQRSLGGVPLSGI